MNGRSFLIDTNIALYLLSGNKTIADIIDGSQLYISFVTELELLGYKVITSREQNNIKLFLKECIIIDINEEIKKLTIQIKQKNQMKLPYSIIAATALFIEIPLLTADKGFKKISKLNLALFEE
jgi:hypothetical protein